ncbi:hypothetical protein [Burkholderia multivorans]|uniref:hypothetical protein n=1 Tax=Burkholderia multivorans TaxID=87883 RepID=UPI001C6127B5|nr:hypothetical protein [Burkholderia multivorans]
MVRAQRIGCGATATDARESSHSRIRPSGPQCSFTAIFASDDARFTRSIVCHAFHRIATAPNADHSTIDVSRRTPVRIAATIALPHIFFDR